MDQLMHLLKYSINNIDCRTIPYVNRSSTHQTRTSKSNKITISVRSTYLIFGLITAWISDIITALISDTMALIAASSYAAIASTISDKMLALIFAMIMASVYAAITDYSWAAIILKKIAEAVEQIDRVHLHYYMPVAVVCSCAWTHDLLKRERTESAYFRRSFLWQWPP